MIYLGSDHAGFHLKEEIKKYLKELERDYEDMGSLEMDAEDDYPDFAATVAKKVVDTGEKGILFCGSGLGMCIVANKIKGVRACSCTDEFLAQSSREHNDANILCLGGRVLNVDEAKKIVRIWLETEFSGEKRHVRRINKIKQIER